MHILKSSSSDKMQRRFDIDSLKKEEKTAMVLRVRAPCALPVSKTSHPSKFNIFIYNFAGGHRDFFFFKRIPNVSRMKQGLTIISSFLEVK